MHTGVKRKDVGKADGDLAQRAGKTTVPRLKMCRMIDKVISL